MAETAEPMTTADRVRLLAVERPDLLPLVRQLLDRGGEGWFDDVEADDLAELTRRGLLTVEHRPLH